MLTPFMFPEAFIIALVVLPIGVHVVEEISLTGSGYDGGDIGVLTVGVTVLVEGPITMIWPKCDQLCSNRVVVIGRRTITHGRSNDRWGQ